MKSGRRPTVGASISRSIAWLITAIFVVSGLFPAYWMVISSIKTRQELFTSNSPLWVHHPVLSEYQHLLATSPFGSWFTNSIVISLVATIIAVVFGAVAAYGINRSPRIGVRLAQIALTIYVVPRALFVVPFFILLRNVGLLDTRFGVILAYLTFTLPFTIWLMVGFFDGIPRELDEAALVDGCTRLGTLVRVIMPLALPGIVATAIFVLSEAWNEFMYPLALIQTPTRTTITVGVTEMRQGDVFAWGQIMAAGTIASIPILVFFLAMYRRIIGGMVAGSVKG